MSADCPPPARRGSTAMRRSLVALACLLFVPCTARASSGTCPAGVPSGVTRCYFIAASGTDTNNGNTEDKPWLRAPGMPNCASQCAAVTPAPGMGFLFRGGDTWHFGSSSEMPYTGGTWTITWSGSPAANIYWGVDPGWYNSTVCGSSWCRPILNADNPLSTSRTLSSCSYSVGKQNIIVQMSGVNYNTLDNFEMLGLCQSSLDDSTQDTYIRYGFSVGPQFLNLYMHGWTHVQFSCSGDDKGHCFNIFMFQGGAAGNGPPSDTLRNVVIDGSDSDPGGAGACYCDWWNVSNSYFRNVAQAVLRNPHLYHDNVQEYWYSPGDGHAHGNVWESVSDAPGTNAFYNNVLRHLSPDHSGQVGIWPEPGLTTTDYFFNNLMYDTNNVGGNYFNVGQNSGDQGTLIIFNNTFEQSTGNAIFECQSKHNHPFTDANNHLITDGPSAYTSPCYGKTTVGSLVQSHAKAHSQAYTSTGPYAYSPAPDCTPKTCSTVGRGTDETANFCGALATAGLADAAAACRSDTGYACTYNTSNHTVTCPARTANARPEGAAWDVGAYQF